MSVTHLSFLCISSYLKGIEFMRTCKQSGCTVYLMTKETEDKLDPATYADELFYFKEEPAFSFLSLLNDVAEIMRTRRIDHIIALDESDIEKAAILRDYFCIPGLKQTSARYFSDTLSMHVKAAEAGISIPAFCSLFNDNVIHHYIQTISPPWILRPRIESSLKGLKKINNAQQLWDTLHELGQLRYQYMLEEFKPGDVYYIDALVMDGKLLFDWYNRNLPVPTEFTNQHQGSLFRSATVPFQSKTEKALKRISAQILKSFGVRTSAIHIEVVQSKEDEQFYLLEVSPRVAGAHMAEVIEAGSGINLWREWAKLEIALARNEDYLLPEKKMEYSGILLSFHTRIQSDILFAEPEIIRHINEPHQHGMIVKATSRDRVLELLELYTDYLYKEYYSFTIV